MEANPYSIGLSDDDEYAVTKPARGAPPPPRSAVVPTKSSANVAENPHAISLGGSDYPSGTGSTTDEYGQTRQAPRDKTKEGKTTVRVCTAKLIMCAVAIGFLWLTTFGAARGFMDAVMSSDVTPEDALRSWNTTMHNAQGIKADFESCVETKNGVCLSELNATTMNELQRGIDIQRESEATISSAQDKLGQCQGKVMQKHQALKRWMNELSAAGKSWETTPQCRNNTMYADFLKIADGNTTENADAQARSLTKQYQAALSALADQTRDAFSARVAYNAQWASNHTKGLIDALSLNATKINVPNFTLDGAFAYLTPADLDGLSSIKDALGPKMNNTWNQLVVQYANAKLRAELVKNATLAYQAEYNAAYQNMSSYITNTTNWLKDAKETLSRFGGTATSFNIPPVEIGDIGTPGFPSIGDLNMGGFNLSTTAFDTNLDNKLAAYKDAAQQRANNASAAVKAYFEGLDTKPSWYSCIACDYNPPPLLFPTSEEQDEKDSNFNNQLNGLLTNLGDAAASAQVGASKMSNGSYELPSIEFIQAQRSKADLQFAALGGDVDFTNILAGFASISSLILALDYVYRAFRSLSLIVRYWFGSAVGLPDIKISKQKSAEVKEPIGVRLMTFFTSPAFVLLIVGLILFGLFYVMLDLYVPALNEYLAGCKRAGPEGPGTLISNNAYSLVYNNAVGNGQKTIQNHLNDYDTLRQSICGQYVTQTGNTQQQLQAILDATFAAYAQAYSDLQLMSSCMDLNTTDLNFNKTNSKGLNYNDETGLIIPFTTTLQPGVWNENNISCAQNELARFRYIADMTFVCQNVSLCSQMGTCVASVDTSILKRGSWESSCKSERVVLIGITAAGLSVLVYVLWNLGRMLLIMGLGRMYWKHLVPHGFNYIATCTTDGRIPRDTEKEVTSKLQKVISTFERWGVVYLATAVFLQLAWLIPVFVLSQEMGTL